MMTSAGVQHSVRLGASGVPRPDQVWPSGPLSALSSRDAALLNLLKALRERGYSFTTPAPHTHRRVLARSNPRGRTLADLLGWSLPCDAPDIDREVLALMSDADIVVRRGPKIYSRLRVASAGQELFLHSAFPVRGNAHVFFGPDSYRFIDFLRAELPSAPLSGRTILDMGSGSGVGGVFAARQMPRASLTLCDVNPEALRLARINAACAGLNPILKLADGVPEGTQAYDFILANPPYIAGSGLTYSDGGRDLGREVALRWTAAALPHLASKGRMLLYTGAPIVHRRDALRDQLEALAEVCKCSVTYRELDPDVFSATLRTAAYQGVERIAAIGAVFDRLK